MKKLTVLLLALCGVLVLALGGCANGDTFTQKTYSSGDSVIEKIWVNVEDRELEIGASEDNQAYIDYFDGEKEFLDIKLADKQLTVELKYNKVWTDFIGAKPAAGFRKIKVRVPDGVIAELYAKTTNGSIKTEPLSVTEKLSLDADGGNIVCERLSVGKAVDFKAKNGNITASVIGGWDDFSISCKIKKGECNLPLNKENGAKALFADCNNGNIDIEFVK